MLVFCEFLHLREATCPFNTIYHFIQILYRQNRHSKTHILETNNTSAELLVPFEEDYLIEIRTVSDGGDGSSSEENVKRKDFKNQFKKLVGRILHP